MLKVSTPAAVRMTHLLNPKGAAAVLRIIRRDARFRLRVSHLRPGDQTFSHDGRVVLVLDKRMHKSLSRVHLDVRQTDTGPRLKLTPL